jgi:hypothetical protein
MVHPVRLDHKVFKVWTSFPAFYAAEIDKYLNDGQMWLRHKWCDLLGCDWCCASVTYANAFVMLIFVDVK